MDVSKPKKKKKKKKQKKKKKKPKRSSPFQKFSDEKAIIHGYWR